MTFFKKADTLTGGVLSYFFYIEYRLIIYESTEKSIFFTEV